MMNMKKKKETRDTTTSVMVAAVIMLVLIVGGLWWKFIGPGSASSPPASAPQFRDPNTGKMRFGSPAEPP